MNRLVLLLIVAVAAGIAGFLFQVKYRVQDLEQELAALNQQIRTDQEAMHVLRTEWSYLNQPDRIAHLASRHLEMGLMEPLQVAASFEVLPPRPEDFGYAQADLEDVLPEPRLRPATPPGWSPEIRLASAEAESPSAPRLQVSQAPKATSPAPNQAPNQAASRPASEPAAVRVAAAPAPEPQVTASKAPAEPQDDIGDKIAQLMGEAVTPLLGQERSYEALPRALPISASGGVLR